MGATPHSGQGNGDANLELLEERIAYLDLLRSFNDEILKLIRIYTSSENFTLKRCLQEIVGFIQRRFDLYVVGIFLVDEISEEIVLYVSAGQDVPLAELKNFRMVLTDGICGAAALTGKTVVAQDVDRDPRYVRGPLEHTRANTAVPIRIHDKVVGVLDLEDRVTDRFQKDFITMIEDLAVNIGFVIENKRLHDDLREYSEDLERKVEDKVTELRKSEERYRAIVENSPNLTLTTDSAGNISWANRTACRTLGFEQDEVAGLNISRIIKKGHMHKLYTLLRDIKAGGEAHSIQLEITKRDGETRIMEVTGTSVLEGERQTGTEISMRDITDSAVIEKLKKNYTKKLETVVVQRTREIKETQSAAILAIATLAESIDDDTGGHLQRIRHYCRSLAEELRGHPKYGAEITDEYVDLLFDLSPLHDLGKVGIRDYILQKEGKLTKEEFLKMQEHTEIGARALRMAGEMVHRDSIFSVGEMIAHFHHERWDGTGYPAVDINGEKRPLRGDEIPLCARIVALADVYDALTSKRPYKMPFPHKVARDLIVKESGKHFDPELVAAFKRREEEFIRIRGLFPDTHIPKGKPFELPARDRPDAAAPAKGVAKVAATKEAPKDGNGA